MIAVPLALGINTEALRRLIVPENPFANPVTFWNVVAVAILIGVALAATAIASRSGKLPPELAADIGTRTRTWVLLAPIAIVPILAGPLWTMLFIAAISLLSYREFARALGLFRERMTSALVAVGIIGVTFANIDHWRGLVGGIQAVILSLICILNIFPDRPKGYIQRVALGAAAFMLFGVGLGRLGMIANDTDYRPLLLIVLLCVQFNDVIAYCCGKAFSSTLSNAAGPLKLFPNTSPGKTVAGHLGATILTTPLAAWLLHFVFREGPLSQVGHLLAMGLIIAVVGQLGDLLISSVKRDLGLKDMGAVLPGHGGVLDRCNSLLLVAPAVYHYVLLFRGIAGDQPVRILSGGV